MTGVVPADSFYRTTQLGSKGYDSLESILKFAPNVPQHITDAIYRAMAVDINDRFPTVQDFWQELNAQSVEDYHSPVPVVLSKSTAAPAHPAAMITPILPIHDETTFVMERHPQKRRRVGVLLLLLLFALLAGIATALVLPFIEGNRSAQTSTRSTVTVVHTPISKIRHKVTPVATPRITHTPIATQPSPPPLSPVPAGYPGVNGTYNGTIIDFHGNIKNNMSLTIQQNQANISGNFIVIGGLSGSGPFTGSVTNNSNIQFTVRSSGINPLSFTGTVQANGYMMGNYCSLNSNGQCDPNAGGYGTWDVLRVASGSGS